jgi:hypothetical protein
MSYANGNGSTTRLLVISAGTLGVLLIVIAVGSLALAAVGRESPPFLRDIAISIVSALIGLLGGAAAVKKQA